MSRVAPLLLVVALVGTACSGGSDDEAVPTSAAPTTAGTTATTATTEAEPTTTPAETTTTTSLAPTTTIDEQAILAEAEAAYLEAFQVGKEVLRDPDNPENETLLLDSYTDLGAETALENLRLAVDGNFIAVENPENPSFTQVIEGAEFVDGDTDLARMTVCEFNSDRIFERGTAPDGGDSLVRDDPVSILFVIRMKNVEGVWKAHGGTRGEEIRDEVERCSDA